MGISPEEIAGVRLRTPRIELRLPDDADVEALLAVARHGIHDPAQMPFETPWTDTPDADFDAQFRAYHRQARASREGPRPDYQFVAVARDRSNTIIGTQGVMMKGEPPEPETGSWLGRTFQGHGYGTEMRTAILVFAFDVLDLEYVNSGAFVFNAASLAVSRKHGYVETARVIKAPRGVPQESVALRLERATYRSLPSIVPVEVVVSSPNHSADRSGNSGNVRRGERGSSTLPPAVR